MRLEGGCAAVIRQLHCGYTATLLRLLAALPVVLTRIFTRLCLSVLCFVIICVYYYSAGSDGIQPERLNAEGEARVLLAEG